MAREEYDKEVAARREAEQEMKALRTKFLEQAKRLAQVDQEQKQQETLKRQSKDLRNSVVGMEKHLSQLRAEVALSTAQVAELAALGKDEYVLVFPLDSFLVCVGLIFVRITVRSRQLRIDQVRLMLLTMNSPRRSTLVSKRSRMFTEMRSTDSFHKRTTYFENSPNSDKLATTYSARTQLYNSETPTCTRSTRKRRDNTILSKVKRVNYECSHLQHRQRMVDPLVTPIRQVAQVYSRRLRLEEEVVTLVVHLSQLLELSVLLPNLEILSDSLNLKQSKPQRGTSSNGERARVKRRKLWLLHQFLLRNHRLSQDKVRSIRIRDNMDSNLSVFFDR